MTLSNCTLFLFTPGVLFVKLGMIQYFKFFFDSFTFLSSPMPYNRSLISSIQGADRHAVRCPHKHPDALNKRQWPDHIVTAAVLPSSLPSAASAVIF